MWLDAGGEKVGGRGKGVVAKIRGVHERQVAAEEKDTQDKMTSVMKTQQGKKCREKANIRTRVRT